MIDWISEYAQAWGRCTRWMRAKTNEGYPGMDVSARMADGSLGGQKGALKQHFGEVRTGYALAVARVLLTPPLMEFDTRMCFDVHYTDARPQRFKIKEARTLIRREISTAEYFRRLDHSHYHLAARIVPVGEKPLGVNCVSQKQSLGY